jgi:hypothetical protein
VLAVSETSARGLNITMFYSALGVRSLPPDSRDVLELSMGRGGAEPPTETQDRE